MYHKSQHAEYEVICLTHAVTESKLQTKFHYVIWLQTGPRLVADLSQTFLLVQQRAR